MDDKLAVLIGRVILAWGRFDQQLYGALHHLSMDAAAYELTSRRKVQARHDVDRRFQHRLSHLRQFLVELGATKEVLSRTDKFKTTAMKLSRMRAHLAHGFVIEGKNRVRISDVRESNDFHNAIANLRGARETVRKKWKLLRKKHLDIEYTADDLQCLATDIDAMADELHYLRLWPRREFSAQARRRTSGD